MTARMIGLRIGRCNGPVVKPGSMQSIPRDMLVELSISHNKECMFCGNKDISEKLYGLLYQYNDIVAHYFCIVFSLQAMKKNTDSVGIWGYSLMDIENELKRASNNPCAYCDRKGATIRCCKDKCKLLFHFPCGLKNNSMHQYFNDYKSFCQQHRVTQIVNQLESQTSTTVLCVICQENVIAVPSLSTIWAPCCKLNAWFHRQCIQELALNAAKNFKCPLCNDSCVFRYHMLLIGIYIPARNSSWEANNAYREVFIRSRPMCSVEICQCPEGRHFERPTGSWQIIQCYYCGSNGTHRYCSETSLNWKWSCSVCSNVYAANANANRRPLFQFEINSRNSTSLPNLQHLASVIPPSTPIGDPIIISDDDDDIQCLTDIVNTPQRQHQYQQPFPTTSSVYTMNTTNSRMSDLLFVMPYSSQQSQNNRISSEGLNSIIDLTSDDDMTFIIDEDTSDEDRNAFDVHGNDDNNEEHTHNI